MSEKEENKMEKIVSLCKRRGFVFQGSDIYGGLAGTWDYGPLGVSLVNNIKREWWKMFVESREDMYGIDTAILMNEKVWEASGHTGAGFADPMVECKNCKSRFRVDHLVNDDPAYDAIFREFKTKFDQISEEFDNHNTAVDTKIEKLKWLKGAINGQDLSEEAKTSLIDAFLSILEETELLQKKSRIIIEDKVEPIVESLAESTKFSGAIAQVYLQRHKKCEVCNKLDWNLPEQFNLMFEINVGAEGTQKSYLRPETAQGIFINFKNILDSMSPKIPFGIAQIGKAFRNEIAPREFLFRVREFDQMEIEYFVREEEWKERFEEWRNLIKNWHEHIGLSSENIREYEVPDNDLAHYSKRTIDFEYNYPGKGFDEIAGFAYRTNHDLKSHMEASGEKMEYIEPDGSRFIPHVLEPSFGVGRAVMAVLSEAYTEDEMGGNTRTYLKLPVHLAPNRVAVSPLLKNKPELVLKAREVFVALKQEFGNVAWDDNGNVGKRYRRQDEIGTPHCIVIDFETLGEENPDLKDTVTVRDRDTGEQDRVKIAELISYLKTG